MKIRISFCTWILAMALTMTSCATSPIQNSDSYKDTTTSWESRLTALFQETDNAGLTIEELTFFGTPITDLLLEDAISIAEQKGFAGAIQPQGDGFSYRASSPDCSSPNIYLYQVDTNDFLTWISYTHVVPAGEFWGRNETEAPVWIGIRDIYTYDSLENVFSDLNYSNSAEIATTIQEILSLPSKEALSLLWQLPSYGFCCETSGESVDAKADRLTEWRFSWTATDPQSQKQYVVEFQYLVEDDCLTAVDIFTWD